MPGEGPRGRPRTAVAARRKASMDASSPTTALSPQSRARMGIFSPISKQSLTEKSSQAEGQALDRTPNIVRDDSMSKRNAAAEASLQSGHAGTEHRRDGSHHSGQATRPSTASPAPRQRPSTAVGSSPSRNRIGATAVRSVHPGRPMSALDTALRRNRQGPPPGSEGPVPSETPNYGASPSFARHLYAAEKQKILASMSASTEQANGSQAASSSFQLPGVPTDPGVAADSMQLVHHAFAALGQVLQQTGGMQAVSNELVVQPASPTGNKSPLAGAQNSKYVSNLASRALAAEQQVTELQAELKAAHQTISRLQEQNSDLKSQLNQSEMRRVRAGSVASVASTEAASSNQSDQSFRKVARPEILPETGKFQSRGTAAGVTASATDTFASTGKLTEGKQSRAIETEVQNTSLSTSSNNSFRKSRVHPSTDPGTEKPDSEAFTPARRQLPDRTHSNSSDSSVVKPALRKMPERTLSRNSRTPSNGTAKLQRSLSARIDRLPSQLSRAASSFKLKAQTVVARRTHVAKTSGVYSLWAALWGTLGYLSVVMQNELIFSGTLPKDISVNLLKLLNSICTALALFCIYKKYFYSEMLKRFALRVQGKKRAISKLSVEKTVLRRKAMWMEILVVALHVPPFYTTELGSENMGNFILYRAETVDAAWSSFRLYLVFRIFRNLILERFPKRHVFSMLTSMNFGTGFALKRGLEGWSAVIYITASWMILVLVFGYWFRLAEITACQLPGLEDERCEAPNAQFWSLDGVVMFEKRNDLYVQNGFWAVFMTTFTVGYGDLVPLTHLGRLVAVLCTLSGVVLVSMLTAALGNVLSLSQREFAALMLMEKDDKYFRVRRAAVETISSWWRQLKVRQRETKSNAKGHAQSNAKGDARDHFLRTCEVFKRARTAYKEMTMEECESFDAKVNHISVRIGRIYSGIVSLGERVRAEFDDRATPNASRLAVTTADSESFLEKVQGQWVEAATALVKLNRADMQEGTKAWDSMTHDFSQSRSRRRHQDNTPEQQRLRVDLLRGRADRNIGLLSLSGAFASVLQNELVFRNDDVGGSMMDMLKLANMIFSLLSIPFVCKSHIAAVQLDRLNCKYSNKKKSRGILTVSWTDLCKRPSFWVELVVCLLCVPPGFTYELGVTQLSNFVLYRIETLGMAFNLLRSYILVRLVRDLTVHTMPKRFEVASIWNITIDYGFVAKVLMNSNMAGLYIGALFLVLSGLFSFWLRAFETSACDFASAEHPLCQSDQALVWRLYGNEIEKSNFLYVQNAWWTVFITATTVGYGDFTPVTHMGRLVTILTTLVGVFLTALLTAALAKITQRTPQEENAMNLLNREQAKIATQATAAKVLQLWWHTLMGRRPPLSIRGKHPKLVRQLREYSRLSKMDLEEMASTTTQINHIFVKTSEISDHLSKTFSALDKQVFSRPASPFARSPRIRMSDVASPMRTSGKLNQPLCKELSFGSSNHEDSNTGGGPLKVFKEGDEAGSPRVHDLLPLSNSNGNLCDATGEKDTVSSPPVVTAEDPEEEESLLCRDEIGADEGNQVGYTQVAPETTMSDETHIHRAESTEIVHDQRIA